MSEIHNAQIKSTSLGYEGHGIMTSWLTLEWDGGGVGFGGYSLGGKSGIDYIEEIMKVVGVERWEDLKGKYVRVETDGWGTPVVKIGNLIKDKWLNQKEFFSKYE